MNRAYQGELSKRAHGEEFSFHEESLAGKAVIFIQSKAGSAKKKDVEHVFPYPLTERDVETVMSILCRTYGSFYQRVSVTPVPGKQGKETLITIKRKKRR